MNIPNIEKIISAENNVYIRVLDSRSGIVLSEHQGHNSATNSMLLGIAHYLKGDGVFNQGHEMLSAFVPKYISLGTMGLINQDADSNGLPAGIGVSETKNPGESDEEYEIRRFKEYMEQVPGYGADGYNSAQNNGRAYFGLGPMFNETAVKCELISATFGRSPITYRSILPEAQSELPETIDIVFSAMVSTGALAQFRGDNDYVFVTEVGMWSKKQWVDNSQNGLLAGYRIVPPNSDNYDMNIAANRQILKQNILRVGKNQVVQIIWKIQLGIAGSFAYDSSTYRYLMEIIEELIDHPVSVDVPNISAPISMAVEPSVVGTGANSKIIYYGDTIGCESEFYFNTSVSCTIGDIYHVGGRVYTAYENRERIAIVMHVYSAGYLWTAPLFISRYADGVAFDDDFGEHTTEPGGTVEYDDATWYFSGIGNAMQGDFIDITGTMQLYPIAVDFGEGRYTDSSVLAVLRYVGAVAI